VTVGRSGTALFAGPSKGAVWAVTVKTGAFRSRRG
jgi:hypothetical protein